MTILKLEWEKEMKILNRYGKRLTNGLACGFTQSIPRILAQLMNSVLHTGLVSSFRVIGLLVILVLTTALHAKTIGKQEVNKKYNLSICAIFKNEAIFLKEWIEYHRLVGVDHFYLYDNGSSDSYMDVVQSYIKEGIVTLIAWPDLLNERAENHDAMWALSTQTAAYENAARIRAVNETKWLVFVDVNEFLIPSEANNLKDILEKYQDCAAVTISSDFFDASYVDTIPRRKLVVESVELTAPELNPPKEVTKAIFKPVLCKGFTWPPYQCHFKGPQATVKLKKSELSINRYINRFRGFFHFGKRKEKLNVDSRMLTEEEKAELLNEGYQIEDKEYAIQRFIPWLLKKLGYDTSQW